jgi:hypothetical protein
MHNVSTQARGEQLAKQLNLGDVVSWRLHWLICELDRFQTKANALEVRSRQLQESSDALMGLVQELQGITVEFEHFCQQTKTMLGLDYNDEVQPLLDVEPKYKEFCEKVQQAKSILAEKAKAVSEADLIFMMSRIESAAKPR